MTASPHQSPRNQESAGGRDRRRTTVVILDVDGTLVDSNDAHAQAWKDAFAEAGVDVDYGQIRRSIGMGGDKLMPHVSGMSKDSPEGTRISNRRGEIFKERYLPHLRPFPGVRELVERFARDGHRVVVASSADEDELGPLLEAAGVSTLIQERTSSDDAEHSKPDPDIVQAALKQSGAEPGAAIMLGDTPYDVAAATGAGIRVVGVECGGWSRQDLSGATEVYKDPAAILAAYDASVFSRLKSGPASGPAASRGHLSGTAHRATFPVGIMLIALGITLCVRGLAHRGRIRTPSESQLGPHGSAGLGPLERAELRTLITRTS
ncbi:MAG: HAD family hydrolase [Acidobacteria bacterium]|nr:HAD family hydrolase [Acidobacteriota bacterium]